MATAKNSPLRHKERGVVFILLLALMATAAVAALTANLWGSNNAKDSQRAITRQALKNAKAALLEDIELGRATGFGSAINGDQPANGVAAAGRLACPDGNGDGVEILGCTSGNGPAAIDTHSLGLLPWQTLGIQRLPNDTSECLWYAVSGAVKNNRANVGVNGDVNGQFSVIQPVKNINPANGVVTWTERLLAGDTSAAPISANRAIAVIIAPGAALRNQNRTPLAGSRECPLPSALAGIPNAQASAAQFLETYAGTAINANNAAIALPAIGSKIWVQADEDKERLNDELIWITAEEFSRAVTKRAIRLYATAIDAFAYGFYDDNTNAYVAGQGYYPWAASVAGGPCVLGRLQGFVPFSCNNVNLNLAPTLALGPPLTVNLANSQIAADGWNIQAHYAVSESCTLPLPVGQVQRIPPFTAANAPTAVCRPGARIGVGSDTNSVHALILLRGRPLPNQIACGAFGTMFNCIENANNRLSVLTGNALVGPPFPATIAPSIYDLVGAGSNDLLHLFRQRTN